MHTSSTLEASPEQNASAMKTPSTTQCIVVLVSAALRHFDLLKKTSIVQRGLYDSSRYIIL